MKRRTIPLLGILVSLYMAGCGGSAPTISVAITAASSTVDGGDTTTLTATVTNDVNSAGVTWSASGGATLSNTTTTSATITLPAATASQQTVTVTATSVHDATKTGTVTITVPAKTSVTGITNASLAGSVGAAYSINLNSLVTGGIAPYKWTATGLPPCLTLSSSGTLTTTSGLAPTAACAGTYNITFTVTDSGTPTPIVVTTLSLSLTIAAPTITFPSSLSPATDVVGTAYSASAAASGALGATTYSIVSGSLPASGNLTLNPSTGLISGTPHAADVGTATFKVKVVDAYGDTATSGSLSIHITAPTITFPSSLAAGTVGTAYSASAAASGAVGATTYSIASGSLPASGNLRLNTSTGLITGTPHAADVGTATFTVKVVDAYGDTATSGSLSIHITAPTITFPSSLAAGTVGTAYSASAAASGAAGATTYSIASGSLPASGNLTLNTSTGLITGTPHAADVGTATFTVKVVDAYGDTVTSGTLSIKINAAPAIVLPATLPAVTAGVALTGTTESVAATGGAGALTYSITAGSLSPLTLNSSTGAITGTPTTAGSLSFTVQAADNYGDTPASQAYTLTVNPGAATHFALAATSSTTITAGGTVNFSVTAKDVDGNTATGYAGTVHFTSSDSQATAGAGLPANSTLTNGVGAFTATLKTAGTQSITATDTGTSSITGTLSGITVTAALASKLLIAAPANATNNVAFNFTVTAEDQYNNTVTTFPDTVTFSSTDGSAVLPGNSGLTNGTKQFSATLKTNGSQTITATDMSNGSVKGTSGSINVSTALIVTTSSLNPLDVGQAPTQTMSASGGSGITADYSWSWTATSGSLPPGLSMGANGAIGGSPTTAGTYNVTVKVTDTGTTPNGTATANLSIMIYAALSLPASNSLPAGYTGVAYTGSIAGSGGSGSLTISITSALSPANGTLAASVSGTSVNLTGTPANATSESLTVKLTDNTTGNSTSVAYTFSVGTPPTPALPTASSSTPGPGTVGQGYAEALTVSNSIGPNYTWMVNGSQLTNNTPVSIGDGLSVETTGNGTLSISGTPANVSNSPGVQFSVVVKDNTSGVSSSSTQYTIVVNPNGSTVSGQFFMNNNCGGGGTLPTFTVTINTSPSQSVQTQSDGSYTFTGIPNGTYTLTPSIPGATSSLFYPASYTGVTLNTSTNNNVSGETFNAMVGFTVSGTVSYSEAQTGQTYLFLSNNNCGGNSGGPGTSISEATLTSGGAFSIRGVAPGSYTLAAYMDPLGQGAVNTIDPSGTTSVTVTNANATNAAVTMTNPTFSTPSSNPGLQVFPDAGGVVVFYQPPSTSVNGNKVENANEYEVQWSTSPTLANSGGPFATPAGSHTFKAIGASGATIWILNNTVAGANTFTSGATYYFQARAFNLLASTTHPSGWSTYTDNSGNPLGVSVGGASCSSNCTTVSGSVTIPSGIAIAAGAPLYVGFYQIDSSGKGPSAFYASEIASPVAGGSGNSYSLSIPSGSGYVLFGLLDQNNDGLIDVGDVTNTRNNNSTGETISGNTMTGQNLTLSSANSAASVTTQYQSSDCSGCSSPNTNYQIGFEVREAGKLPVAVTLTSGPNTMWPFDLSACTDCGNVQFYYYPSLPGGTPAVGDQYNFTVTYSDGTQDTGSTVNGKVTAFGSTGAVVGPSDLATNLAPVGTSDGTSTTPTFTWTFPANPSNYVYSFYISPNNCSGSCNDIWDVPSNNSNSNGFTYAETSGGSGTTGTLTWGVDPISGDNSSPTGPLTLGDQYNWQIQVQDSNGNRAQAQTWYQP